MNTSALWYAKLPTEWPAPPARMSFHRLRQIESCPRRAALSMAAYPEVWTRPGYPPKVNRPLLIGRVVHRSVETIAHALAGAGCCSVNEVGAVQALRELGGYSAVAARSAQQVLSDYSDNPRVAHSADVAEFSAHVPEIRERVQILVARLRLTPNPIRKRSIGRHDRCRLLPGAHFEVELRAPLIGWVGVADLIDLANYGCKIVDFKAGEPKQEHKLQVQIYALLWIRDSELNPGGRLPDALVLSYCSGDVNVGRPSLEELAVLEKELVARTGEALVAFGRKPPEARPDTETCRLCEVRQLCDEYWASCSACAQADSFEGDKRPGFTDAGVQIGEQRGPLSWDACVTACQWIKAGTSAIVRTGWNDNSFATRVKPGDYVRLLNVHVGFPSPDEEQPVLITLTAGTESFGVPPGQ